MVRRVLVAIAAVAWGIALVAAALVEGIDGSTRVVVIAAIVALAVGFLGRSVTDRDLLRSAWSQTDQRTRTHAEVVERIDGAKAAAAAADEELRARLDAVSADLGALERSLAASRTEMQSAIGSLEGVLAAGTAATDERVRRAIGDLEMRLDEIESGHESVVASVADVRREQTQAYRQLEAHIGLVQALDLDLPLPQMRGSWALPPDAATLLVRLSRENGCRSVLELGSGISTVVMARVMQRAGSGRVVAIEHDEGFAAATRRLLDASGLGDWARVVVAELADIEVSGTRWRWYDPSFIPAVGPIDMLIVDGPPGEDGKRSRYPALPLLADHLVAGAIVYLDDTLRPDERSVAEQWEATLPVEPVPIPPLEKGGSVFRWIPGARASGE